MMYLNFEPPTERTQKLQFSVRPTALSVSHQLLNIARLISLTCLIEIGDTVKYENGIFNFLGCCPRAILQAGRHFY